MNDIEISITKDTATSAVERLVQALGSDIAKINDRVGQDMRDFVQNYLYARPVDNKQGWPSQGFYAGAAAGTRYHTTSDGVVIAVDNEKAPGAMKHAYNRGEEGKIYIYASGKLLTVPARPEFSGHSAREFDNLKFVPFKSGAKALVIDEGGTSRFGPKYGEHREGTGSRSAGLVAYWLTDSVEQNARPEVMPSRQALIQEAELDFKTAVDHLVGGQN